MSYAAQGPRFALKKENSFAEQPLQPMQTDTEADWVRRHSLSKMFKHVFLDSLFDAGADNFTQSRILGSVLAFIVTLSSRFHSSTGSRRKLFYSFNHFLDLDCTKCLCLSSISQIHFLR